MVIARLTKLLTARNIGVDRLTSKVKVVAALKRCTPAHSIVSPLNR